jgi:type II secretory pathway component PulF
MLGIFGPPRISLVALAALAHRLSVQLASGVDMRRIWQHEVEAAHGTTRNRFVTIRDEVNHGQNLAEAFAATDGYFPPLFLELVNVGEQTGHLAEVLRELASNYDHQITLRRKFRSELTGPILKLVLALTVVGVLIELMGLINQSTGQNLDILGFGLLGTPGLIVYLTGLGVIAVAGFVLWQNVRRGMLWTRPLQRLVMRVPALSGPLVTLALSRLTWALSLTMGAGMDMRRALDLSLRSTHTLRYIDQIDPIWRSIRNGSELHEAMDATGVFPARIVDAVAVAERSGRLSETMQVLSEQYQDEARAALMVLTRVAGGAVWLAVSGLIIFLIFRIFSFYLGVLDSVSH